MEGSFQTSVTVEPVRSAFNALGEPGALKHGENRQTVNSFSFDGKLTPISFRARTRTK